VAIAGPPGRIQQCLQWRQSGRVWLRLAVTAELAVFRQSYNVLLDVFEPLLLACHFREWLIALLLVRWRGVPVLWLTQLEEARGWDLADWFGGAGRY
jgi:hypothetical protein